MGDVVHEWIEKAEEDFRVALSLRRLRRHPAHNSVCFHSQQCIEKYLKAYFKMKDLLFAKFILSLYSWINVPKCVPCLLRCAPT